MFLRSSRCGSAVCANAETVAGAQCAIVGPDEAAFDGFVVWKDVVYYYVAALVRSSSSSGVVATTFPRPFKVRREVLRHIASIFFDLVDEPVFLLHVKGTGRDELFEVVG